MLARQRAQFPFSFIASAAKRVRSTSRRYFLVLGPAWSVSRQL